MSPTAGRMSRQPNDTCHRPSGLIPRSRSGRYARLQIEIPSDSVAIHTAIRIHGPVDSVTADVTLCSRGCRPVSPMPTTPGLRRGADQIAGQSLKRRQAQAERRKALRSAQDRRTRTGAGPGRLLRRWSRWRRRSRLGVSVRRAGQVPIRRGADVPGPAGPCSSQTNFAGTPAGRPGGSWSRI